MTRSPGNRIDVLLWLCGALVASGACSCVRVHAWERGRLASRAMVDPFAYGELATQYRSKVVESKTGGGLPGTAPGGGCGCTPCDLRLGRIQEHAASADVEWLIFGHRGGFGTLRVDARIELSRLRYEQVPSAAVFAQIVQLGLAGSY